jgi:hypothetical protein
MVMATPKPGSARMGDGYARRQSVRSKPTTRRLRRDEFYCVFTQKLTAPTEALSLPASLSYLLSELRRFAGEPAHEVPAGDAKAWAEEWYARPALLMAKNVQESPE